MDLMLADFCDDLFLDGQSLAVAEKTVAAIEFFHIDQRGKLVHAKRALRGFRKLAPPASRLPLPRLICMGIAMVLMAQGRREMAIKVVMDFDMYLRPSEGMDVLGEHVVKPVPGAGLQFQRYSVIIRDQDQGKPDKTGIYDNTIQLDNPLTMDYLGPVLKQLSTAKGPNKHIFQFKPETYREQFQKAGQMLGVSNLHTYQLRHGGASDDLNTKLRDFNAVRERGRWQTDASVRRYAKTGKIQKLLQGLSRHNLEYCKWAQANMGRVMMGKMHPRLP